MQQSASLNAAIALTRFGLGAGPGEIEAVGDDARGWLAAQIRPGGAPSPQGDLPMPCKSLENTVTCSPSRTGGGGY